MYHPGLPLPRGQSFAHIIIGLAGLLICTFSPTMTCQWASVRSGLWCSSDLGPILCPLSRAVLPGQPSRAIFAGALFVRHKVEAMSSMVCLIALISVTSDVVNLSLSLPVSWPVPRCCRAHASDHVAQGREVCQPLSHCLAAKGPDMNCQSRPHKPGWLNGRSETLSLSFPLSEMQQLCHLFVDEQV